MTFSTLLNELMATKLLTFDAISSKVMGNGISYNNEL